MQTIYSLEKVKKIVSWELFYVKFTSMVLYWQMESVVYALDERYIMYGSIYIYICDSIKLQWMASVKYVFELTAYLSFSVWDVCIRLFWTKTFSLT